MRIDFYSETQRHCEIWLKSNRQAPHKKQHCLTLKAQNLFVIAMNRQIIKASKKSSRNKIRYDLSSVHRKVINHETLVESRIVEDKRLCPVQLWTQYDNIKEAKLCQQNRFKDFLLQQGFHHSTQDVGRYDGIIGAGYRRCGLSVADRLPSERNGR